MVFISSLIGLAIAGLASARPMPDSSSGNEVAVSAPYGVVESDTAALATQTAAMMYSAAAPMMTESAMMMASSSAMMMESSSAMMMESSSAMMEESTMMEETSMALATSTMMAETATMSAAMSYSTPSYGSGSSSWGGSGYNSCVQQCVASFGAPPSTYTPPSSSYSSGSSNSGATHTIIVAPTQGVLRFVPFATNASVGDTIMFMWGANNHTVTKSSELEVCNKTSDALFTSGEQNKSFVFTQVVNDTNPTFFYCATTGHCEKGMFGIINPPNAAGAATSVSSMMSSMASNSSSVAAMSSYTSQMTAGNVGASSWGASMDMSSMPTWAQQAMVENVMYTRTFLAANPETLSADGSVNIGAAGQNALMLPQDITSALNNAGTSASSAAGSSASMTGTMSMSTPSPSASSNGAGSVAASGAVMGLTAAAAAFFLL